jgi:hypothetical protein
LASCTRDVRQLGVGFIDRCGLVTLKKTIRDSGLWAFRQRRSTRGRLRSHWVPAARAKILMPSARSTASNDLVNWPARSPIRHLTAVARCPSSIEMLRVHAPSGVAVMSAAWKPRGLGRQELLSDGPGAAGVGPIPVSCMIGHTVVAAIRWPSLTSSPCTRRCTMRDYRSRCGSPAGWRIAAAVDGRPDVGGSCNSHLRVTSRRRQPSSVAGVTANTSPHQRRGTNRDIAARRSRSPGS